jgi:hypothetical protein
MIRFFVSLAALAALLTSLPTAAQTLPAPQVIPRAAAPDSAHPVQVRRGCRSTLSPGNQPLIIIDGVTVTSESLLSLNPDDIERVTVMKAPEASALYGSQAQHGALLFSTKRQPAERHKKLPEKPVFRLP